MTRRWWITVLATVALVAAAVATGVILGNEVDELRNEGNTRIIAHNYLPVRNPYDQNETMALEVIHDSPSMYAQISHIPTYITLRVDQEYRHLHDLPMPSEDLRPYYVVFEGSDCADSAIPNPNFNIGYSCVLPLTLSQESQTYTGSASPLYSFAGKYPVLLGTGTDKNAIFTSTQDFIKIEPFQSLREWNVAKLEAYSNVLSIAIAASIAIIAILWTSYYAWFDKYKPNHSQYP